MSLDVALRSVVFYVASCSTCAKISQKHRTKQQAKRERVEKIQLETEQPGLYRHPSPFSTNPFWEEEIMLGPGPPKRKGDRGGSKNGSSRALHTSGPGSSLMSGTTSTDAGSSPTIVAVDHRISGEDWNRKRYQREDEELWGQKPHAGQHTGQKFMDAIARAGNSVGISDRILGGRLTGRKVEEEEEEEAESYYVARNPPLNDLHPPIVSTAPAHKGATRWMLQPPPPAKVMEGKERANRSRSDSGASSRKGADGVSLGRQVSSRLVEAKLKRGETPEMEVSSLSLADPISKPKAVATSGQQRQDRIRNSSSDSSDSSSDGHPTRRKRRPPPINITPPRRPKDKAEHIPIPSKPSEVSTTFRLAPASRPPLATIPSSSLPTPQVKVETTQLQSTETAAKQPKEKSKENEIPNDAPKESSESSENTKKVYPVVVPVVHHSFQGKNTFVFPPPKDAAPEANENHSTDEENHAAVDGMTEMRQGVEA